jgi:cytochrome c2
MTGMPAWEYRMSEDDLWALVAFLVELPLLSPARYRAMEAPAHEREEHAQPARKPDAKRGRTAIDHYACVTCHRIPGVVGDNAPVGPPLEGIGARRYIAGVLPNTTENMARWLRNPPAVKPGSKMPDLNLTEDQIQRLVAYLESLE